MTSDLISLEEAWARLAGRLTTLGVETLDRGAAAGCVLARPVSASGDVPGSDVSAMDGIAIGGPLPVTGRLAWSEAVLAAGVAPGARLAPGKAAAIMTGAPVPAGADRVVPVEKLDRDGAGVRVLSDVSVGANIRRRGEVVSRGAEILPAGVTLRAPALSLLAAHGCARVVVHRRPRVGFLTTGNEVVPPDREPGPGQLRDSHTDFVLAALRDLPIELATFGIGVDDRVALRERMEHALESRDVLALGGGVSKGDYDFVRPCLEELGFEALFHGVRVQPGKPLLVAYRDEPRAWAFGLPGNPASVMTGTWLFLRPALRRLLGRPASFWDEAQLGELAESLPAGKDRDRFLPAERVPDGRLRPLAPVGSHDALAYGRAAAIVRIPIAAPGRQAGESVSFLSIE